MNPMSRTTPTPSPLSTAAHAATVADPRLSPLRQFVALALIFTLLLIIAGSTSLFDRDEPRFSRAAVEMVQSGDYLVPKFNGNLRPDKPILIYWLMSAPIRLLGPTEIAVRLPSILGVTASCLLTSLIGRRMFSRRAGFTAALILGTSALPMIMGTLATADGTLLAFTTLAIYAFIELHYGGSTFRNTALLAFALGAAQLTKGPVGLAVPLLTVIGTAIFARGDTVSRIPRRIWISFAIAAVIGIAMFLAWGIPANNATDGEFYKIGVGKHVIDRFIKPAEGHGASTFLLYVASLLLYIPVAIAGLFPWTLHLPGAWTALTRGAIGTRKERSLLLGWIVPTFIMMSLVVTKLPHYILPIFPALALTIAATLEVHRLKPASLPPRVHAWLRGGVWFFSPVALGIAAVIGSTALLMPESPLKWAGPVIGVMLTVVANVAYRAQLREQLARSGGIALGGTIAVAITVVLLVMPYLEPAIKPSPRLATSIRLAIGPDAPVAMLEAPKSFAEASLIFYLMHKPDHPVTIVSSPASIAAWLAEPGPGVLVTTNQALASLKTPLPLMPVIFSQRIVNYSAGSSVEVIALRRGQPALPPPNAP